jgi:hypothetical protein
MLATAFLLLLPLLSMQPTDEVDWGVADFALAGVLVAGTGLLLDRAVRKPANFVYRVAAAAIGVAAIVLGEADDAPGPRALRRVAHRRHGRAGPQDRPAQRVAAQRLKT